MFLNETFENTKDTKKLEETILGSIFEDDDLRLMAINSIQDNDFINSNAKIIFKIIKKLSDDHNSISIDQIIFELKKQNHFDNIGGYTSLNKIFSQAVSKSHFDGLLATLKNNSMLRYMKLQLKKALTNIDEEHDPHSTISFLNNSIMNKYLNDTNNKHQEMIGKVSKYVYEKMEILSKSKDDLTGITSGLQELDKVTNGFQKGDLIILAARPSMGKTALALKFLHEASIKAAPEEYFLFFSLEMSKEQIVQRMMSMASNVSMDKIRTGKGLKEEDLLNLRCTSERFNRIKLILNDQADLDINSLQIAIKKEIMTKKISLIVIDYLQLISNKNAYNQATHEKMAEITRKIKQIAREADCPIITLSQLSRTPEKRENKRPIMSDLRDSGSIEQDADIVMFLYRDDYYSQKKPVESQMSPTELIIRKNRNGAVKTLNIAYWPKSTSFTDYPISNQNKDN